MSGGLSASIVWRICHICNKPAPLSGPFAAAPTHKSVPHKALPQLTKSIGGGTVAAPAKGPIKNWHFGTQETIKNSADMNVNKPLPVSTFDGKFYEWNYNCVYLSK